MLLDNCRSIPHAASEAATHQRCQRELFFLQGFTRVLGLCRDVGKVKSRGRDLSFQSIALPTELPAPTVLSSLDPGPQVVKRARLPRESGGPLDKTPPVTAQMHHFFCCTPANDEVYSHVQGPT